MEQQHKAAWAWKRQEDALEGARERTGDGVLVEHIYGKDVDSLWAPMCALESRPSSEEELKKIRHGVATRLGRVDKSRARGVNTCRGRKYHGRGTFRERARGEGWEGHRSWNHGRRRGDTKWRYTERQKAERGTRN